eukprot:SM000114S24158  [mRNA]  locus=s114:392810:394210:+ [translate_table: standard]
MEEHFVLRVPPDVAARLHALLSAPSSSSAADAAPPDLPLDLAFHGTPPPRPLLLLPAAAFRSAARAMRLPPRPRPPAASYTRPCRGTPPQQRRRSRRWACWGRHRQPAGRRLLTRSLPAPEPALGLPEKMPQAPRGRAAQWHSPAGAASGELRWLGRLTSAVRGAVAEDGRSGTFTVGDQELPAYLLDLPCVVESFKTYDDNTLIKTADVGQMIVVQRPEDAPPQGPECRHGLTPPMRDARRRRFRRDPDLDPELVAKVEKDLQSIMAGGSAAGVDILSRAREELVAQEVDAEDEEGGEAGGGGR